MAHIGHANPHIPHIGLIFSHNFHYSSCTLTFITNYLTLLLSLGRRIICSLPYW
nr:MAG TPA: hypothetical protein [Caudoviricetes sp.]